MWWAPPNSWYSTLTGEVSSSSWARRAKPTSMTPSRLPWAMYARVLRPVEVRVPTRDGGDEARERQDPGRGRAVRVETERVAHHRPHREAAEDRALGPEPVGRPQLVVEGGQLLASDAANVAGSG